MVIPLILIVVTLIFSAFFSGMEIAFVSSNKLKLEIDKKQSGFFTKIANKFTNNPGQYISTILVGNNIALVIYSMQMAFIIRFFLLRFGIVSGTIVIETLVSTLVIIFLAEFIPKAIVRANPNFHFKAFALPMLFFYYLFYPIAVFSTFVATLLLKIFGLKINKGSTISTFDKIDLANLLEQATERVDNTNTGSASQENEMRIFQNALEFPDIKVRDCMIPRVDIDAIDIEDGIEQLKKLFISTQYSRIPVFEGTMDNIIGYVNSKSLFNHPDSIKECMRPIIFVPETMEIDKLLATFIKQQSSIAVVIDEFGGTSGMITLEDILEEIFGEIEDEHDDQMLVEKDLGNGEFIFSSRLEIDYLNEKYNLDIPETDDYETLAGYVIFNNNGLPDRGDTIEIDNKSVTILRMSSSRIELVKVRVK
ncbi:MAG: hemolysin family protein [Rikenellaceae bacterium]|nr:hemolysin family protein [Rikenellaceae bacterium]